MIITQNNKASKEDVQKYLETQEPADVAKALAMLNMKLRVDGKGNKEKATAIAEYIKKNAGMVLAIQYVKTSGTTLKTPFNAPSYIGKATEYTIGESKLETESVIVNYCNGLSVTDKATGEIMKQNGYAAMVIAKVMGSVINLSNGNVNEIPHSGTHSAIPASMSALVSVAANDTRTYQHDDVSDKVAQAVENMSNAQKKTILTDMFRDVPTVTKDSSVRIASYELEKQDGVYKMVEISDIPTYSEVLPVEQILKTVEMSVRSALPRRGLGGRPVLNYFGVPVKSSTKYIYRLQMLVESCIDNDEKIISTSTDPMEAIFMRENGYPNYYVTAESQPTEVSRFAVDISDDFYVFHPKAVDYAGKKGEERNIYASAIKNIATKYKLSTERLIYPSSVAAIAAGVVPHTKVILSDKVVVVNSTKKPVWPEYLNEAGELILNMDDLNDPDPDRIISPSEISNTYCSAVAGICSTTGPYVLVSPFVEYDRIDNIVKEMMSIVYATCTRVYQTLSVSDVTLTVKLISKVPTACDLDLAGASITSKRVIEDIFGQALSKAKKGDIIAKHPSKSVHSKRKEDDAEDKAPRRVVKRKGKEREKKEEEREEEDGSEDDSVSSEKSEEEKAPGDGKFFSLDAVGDSDVAL